MHRSWKKLALASVLGAMGWTAASAALAGDYCCQCKQDKSISIEASDELTAGLECSLKCKKPVKAKAGKCQAPGTESAAPATATPAAAASSKAGAGQLSLFSSEDCSGNAKSISGSSAKLADQGATGIRSYRVESGDPATAFEKPDYAGRRVEPVGVGLCVSPGFEVGAIRVGK